MRRRLFRATFACATGVLLLAGSAVHAEIESLKFHLYGGITNRSKWQISRLLSPYVHPDNIHFEPYRDAEGRTNPWRTIVEITPEGEPLDLYSVTRAIRDTRGVNDGRLVYRTDVTATGELKAHIGWTRRSFGWVPGWVQARGLVTSGLWHHLTAEGSGENFVFHVNRAYDELRTSPHNGEPIRIRGRISGFDGPYPVVVLGEFETVDETNAEHPEKPNDIKDANPRPRRERKPSP